MDVGFSRGFRNDFRISIITSATKSATAFAKINALVHFFLGFKKFDRTGHANYFWIHDIAVSLKA